MSDIITPVGRLVAGHPMEMHDALDNNGQPKKMRDGVTPMQTATIGIAIAKGAETDWKQTEWGQQIVAEANTAWPRGEHGSPLFAWKITDGDSQIPNKKGNKPCDREGYTGHWVMFASSCFSTSTYHAGRYQAHEVIQNPKEIKRGDYIRLCFNTKGNGSTDSPGMYINPVMVELTRAGIEIVSASAPDASAAFGGSAPVMPTGALVDTAVQQAPPVQAQQAPVTPPPVQAPPAYDLADVTPPPPVAEPQLTYNGVSKTKAEWLAMGWNEAQIAQHCK